MNPLLMSFLFFVGLISYTTVSIFIYNGLERKTIFGVPFDEVGAFLSSMVWPVLIAVMVSIVLPVWLTVHCVIRVHRFIGRKVIRSEVK